MKKYFLSAILSGCLLVPASLSAFQDRDHAQQTQAQRYYDRQHKDWHEWNDTEAQNYRRYQEEKRIRKQQEFNRLSRARQQEYFIWRHAHGDDHR